jgi:ubiquinone/menaquinone biosynthesis C-methylase UbiE
MSAIATETKTDTDFTELKLRLKDAWMAGDYDLFSRFMAKDAELFFQGLGVTPGTRLLDVGCGSGQLALIAARAGAHVTGCDISTNWLEKARERAAFEGLDVIFEEGDAESLPYQVSIRFRRMVSWTSSELIMDQWHAPSRRLI